MISASQVTRYLKCPFSYKLRYVDKIKIDIISEALTKGSDIHKLLEQNIFESDDEEYQRLLSNAKNFLEEFEQHENLTNHEYINEQKLFGTICGQKAIGILDRTYPIPGISIDWKTGSQKFDKKNKMYNKKEYCVQAYFYKELVKQNNGKDLKDFLFVFLGSGTQWHPEFGRSRFDTEGFNKRMEKIIQKVLDNIKKKNFEKNRHILCGWCEYRYICDLV